MEDLEYLKDHATEIEFDGIDESDYPDYCDAFICSAVIDDRYLTDDELDMLNSDRGFVYNKLMGL